MNTIPVPELGGSAAMYRAVMGAAATLIREAWLDPEEITEPRSERLKTQGVALRRLLDKGSRPVCKWNRMGDDDDLGWDTGCGDAYSIIDGKTPTENGMKFCPFCGGRLVELELETETEVAE